MLSTGPRLRECRFGGCIDVLMERQTETCPKARSGIRVCNVLQDTRSRHTGLKPSSLTEKAFWSETTSSGSAVTSIPAPEASEDSMCIVTVGPRKKSNWDGVRTAVMLFHLRLRFFWFPRSMSTRKSSAIPNERRTAGARQDTSSAQYASLDNTKGIAMRDGICYCTKTS